MINTLLPNKKEPDRFKLYLIYILSFIGLIFSFGLAIKGMYTSSKILTTLLFTAAAITLSNLIYLKKTNNTELSGSIFIYTYYILMFYLVYTGGVNGNTGPLWIYFLAPLTFYIKGLTQGIYNIVFFFFILYIILYILEPNVLKAEYHHAYKLRILLAFILTTFVSAAYEYSREMSYQYANRLKEELEKISLFDDLTGSYNRRGYEKFINNTDYNHGAILMCDIDKLKQINDDYGHLAGDYSIKEIAECIKGNVRSEDIVVRWGGDEFIIFLPNISIENAKKIAKKIQKSIHSYNLNYKGQEIRLSISIGVSILDKESNLEESIREADNNMYISKYKNRLEA